MSKEIYSEGRLTSKNLKLCMKCNKTWEYDSFSRRDGAKIVHHEDFPTYKLQREHCAFCI